MRLKLLLFVLMFTGGIVAAQDTIRTLIITEAHLGAPDRNYVEITNVGTDPVQLSQFEVGRSRADNFIAGDDQKIMLPDQMLQPNESFFIPVVRDWGVYAYFNLGETGWQIGPVVTPVEMFELADIQIHVNEAGAENDSVSDANPIGMYFGREAVYIKQHIDLGDTVVTAVVDQVMGVFDETYDGGLRNKGMALVSDAYDVAGFPAAGNDAMLVRKAVVKQGNLEFVRGSGEDDSEWIALPQLSSAQYRMQPWTYKNHGAYVLDENTLVSDVATVDFPNKTITVPWGTRRMDGIMRLMEKKPGVYWSYILSPVKEDSTAYGCKTGDRLAITVCGNEAYRDTFDIIVSDPLASDNFVVPVANWDDNRLFLGGIYSGHVSGWPQIETSDSEMDTITGSGAIYNLGIPYATRIDTLLERLEKPEDATWEIVPADENATRPDLIDGDILRVTAEDGTPKEYYIKVKFFEGSENNALASITWPDIPDPELYEIIYGWQGDTIPGFRPNTFNYQLKLSPDIEDVPATVAKPEHENAVVDVTRAKNLASVDPADRTTTYTVTATNDTSVTDYTIEWQREVLGRNLQPYEAEPFFSEYIARYYFNNNFLEVCNPGNVPLDLSDYMIVGDYNNNPAEVIQTLPEDWMDRYTKYVPGYKWVDSTTWATKPGYLERDLGVNAMVQPGDVFCLSEIDRNGWWGYGSTGWNDTVWPGITESDVNFTNNSWASNPWGEPVGATPITNGTYAGGTQYLFKILNDSVKEGLKPATDPNDFELIEVIGTEDESGWMFGYENMVDGFNFTSFVREPQFTFPVDELEGSFGDTTGTPSQWRAVNRATPERVGGWPEQWIATAMLSWGQHFFHPYTDYVSTISSNFYKVSGGYKIEELNTLKTGTTVNEFLPKITKANEGQTLTVVSSADGTELAGGDAISDNDTLLVTSADEANVTKYVIGVTEEGLSSDALITSNDLTVTVEEEPAEANNFIGTGTLGGFDYGTTIENVMFNIALPAGAKLTILKKDGNFVPLTRLNFDTTYVKSTVNVYTVFRVVAEDMVTTIDYTLTPNATSDDAIVVSDYFDIDQDIRLIDYVPGGISVSSFMDKLVPSKGATMVISDKSGLERTDGKITVRLDDKVVVTSESGEVINTYFLSFLGNDENLFVIYLVSPIYEVDQFEYMILGVVRETEVADFLSNIEPSLGATVVVLDSEGNEKSSGAVAEGDQVKVSTPDGNLSAVYDVEIVEASSVGTLSSNRIKLYPNPTQGNIFIDGLKAGERVQIFNTLGSVIVDYKANAASREVISLEDQPAGVYLIMVTDNEQVIGRYKAIKR